MKKGISLLLAIIMLFSVVNVNVFAASVTTPKTTSSNDVGGIKVYWNKVDGAVKYNVYRRVGGSSSWVLAGTTTGTQILDRGVSNGKYYAYSVRAYDSQNNYSAYNQKMTYTTKCVFTPILNLLENTTNGLKLTWDAVPGASYRVYRRGAGTSTWTYLGTTSSTNYTDGKAVSGKYWRYTVRAVSSGYYSGFDTNGRYTMRLANPYSIKAKQDPEHDDINITWAKINGATRYLVYRRSAGQTNWMCIGETDENKYTDFTVLPGQYYRYTVRAIRKNNWGDLSTTGAVVKTRENEYYGETDYNDPYRSTCYEIYTADDLFKFAKEVNSGCSLINAVLKNNINLNNRAWTPIGRANEVAFFGNFDGNGYTISNLNCNIPNGEFVGLFGWSGGNVANLTVTGSVNGKESVGGIVGYNMGTVTNCINKCNVSGDEAVGGIAGANNLQMESCINVGKVKSNDTAGGLAGVNYLILKNSTNNGSVTGGYNVGGVAGFSDGTEISCTNFADVSGISAVGGVTGHTDDREGLAIVENCENSGSVAGDEGTIGGVVGYSCGGTVVSCTNTGKVEGYGCVGGVAGENDEGGILNSCTNKGVVIGHEIEMRLCAFGGVVGVENGNVINCYYYSNTAKSAVGYCFTHERDDCASHSVTAII